MEKDELLGRTWTLDESSPAFFRAGEAADERYARAVARSAPLLPVLLADDGAPDVKVNKLLRAFKEGGKDPVLLRIGRDMEFDMRAAHLWRTLRQVLSDRGEDALLLMAAGSADALHLGGFVAATFTPVLELDLAPTTLDGAVQPLASGAYVLPGTHDVEGFRPAEALLIDTAGLSRLPAEALLPGVSRTVLLGAFYDRALFERLERFAQAHNPMMAFADDMHAVVCACVDAFLAHAQSEEGAAGLSSFLAAPGPGMPPPGGDLAIALAAMYRAAAAGGVAPAGEALRVCQLLERFQMPIVSERPRSFLSARLAELDQIGESVTLPGPIGSVSQRTCAFSALLQHL